ncbi:Ribose 5-phosphate isomerase A [Candidatus Johnevansia muelleri]|uniref:Ribose-5-phosphate isomerase A n=1 Tax=Candidatus Johnevansia muelleri TaxID=1495769 RepID=A0A078KIC9_9GAMM|nr:Ribose 5-phosphate isomerase A [Candidatus Evansia muelleri]
MIFKIHKSYIKRYFKILNNMNNLKFAAANAAIEEIRSYLQKETIIGIGTGTTINFFIDLLKKLKGKFLGAVASSQSSAIRLKKYGILLFELNDIKYLPFYIDSADEIDINLSMIKGGGAALTREKIIAKYANRFICIADETKLVKNLGKFPIPIEFIPIAKNYIINKMYLIGANPIYRKGLLTDNGNHIIDLYNLINYINPVYIEKLLNNISGIVSNGIFAQRSADLLLLSKFNGVDYINR